MTPNDCCAVVVVVIALALGLRVLANWLLTKP